MARYFVNLNAAPGGSGASRVSPFNALSALPTLAAGDIVDIQPGGQQVMSGTYTVSGSGSAAAPITIRRDPEIDGPRPVLQVATQGGSGITATSRSHLVFEGFDIEGDPAWTSQDTTGLFLNGALTNIVARDMQLRRARFNLVGGFTTTGITLDRCSAVDCRSDGLRWFSGAGSYVWSDIRIIGGTYSRNGLAEGANGSGISFFIQLGHTGTVVRDLQILGPETEDNYRGGILLNNGSQPWTDFSGAGAASPPLRLFEGLLVRRARTRRNGGAGLSVLGAKPSANLPAVISRVVAEDNGARTTIGNIWTGGCQRAIIERNICRRALTNGTVVGDGQGIFDDQWNEDSLVRWNLVENNVFQAFNPDVSAFGIGIYRASRSKHYGNVIRGCRYGYFIGSVEGALAPVVGEIDVDNNTIVDTTLAAIYINSVIEADALRIRNNLLLRADQDVIAQSAGAGDQTWTGNKAIGVTTKYTGNNVGEAAVDHTALAAGVAADGRLAPNSPLLVAGTNLGSRRGIEGFQRRGVVGAYAPARLG